MESFKDFFDKKEERLDKMSPEKHIEKLDKTMKSIHTHIANGGHGNTQRGWELTGRYNDHADVLKQKYPKHWTKYNKERGYDPGHNGYDLYA